MIGINQQLRDKEMDFAPRAKLDLSMITSGAFPIEAMPKRFFNFIDLETAIEIFTPVYQLFLTDNDFWRATNSLQLDETIGIYAAKILKRPEHLIMLNNKRPLAQMNCRLALDSPWTVVGTASLHSGPGEVSIGSV